MAPAIYLTTIAAGALIAVFLMRETSSRSFRKEDQAATVRAAAKEQRMH
ncbi:hypothetical protein ACFQ36_12020 [Arthrobacter sp. GCM10027362]